MLKSQSFAFLLTSSAFILSPLNKNYIPNKKGEGTTGLIIGLSFVYIKGLSNVQKRLNLLIGDID